MRILPERETEDGAPTEKSRFLSSFRGRSGMYVSCFAVEKLSSEALRADLNILIINNYKQNTSIRSWGRNVRKSIKNIIFSYFSLRSIILYVSSVIFLFCCVWVWCGDIKNMFTRVLRRFATTTNKTYGKLKDSDRIFTNVYKDSDPYIDGALRRVTPHSLRATGTAPRTSSPMGPIGLSIKLSSRGSGVAVAPVSPLD